jgi:hypothetical protein
LGAREGDISYKQLNDNDYQIAAIIGLLLGKTPQSI